MNKQEVIEIARKHDGYIYKDIIKKYGIPTIYLTRLVKEGKMEKLSRGVYFLPEFIDDPFFVKSIVYSNMVYTGETALYLNNLSNRQFPGYEVTFPYGTNIPKIKGFIIKQSRKSTFNLGVEMVETPYGNKVKCYNKERCICDLFIRDDYDHEDKVYAINEYRNNYLNRDLLYEYAKALNIYETIRDVFEVIGWN